MMLFMRTTFDINDALLEELREQSRLRKQSMRRVLEDTLRRGLAAPVTPDHPVRLTTFPIGIKPAYQGMSMNQLYDQVESEDTLKVAEP